MAQQTRNNHGGGRFATSKGINRKSEARYDARAKDFNAMIAQNKIADGHRDVDGYTRPGSRKKVGG